MVFNGFRLVSMVFQGSFKVFDGFGWFFQGSKVSKWLSNIFEYFWLISSSHCLDNWLGVFPISLNFFTFNYFPLPTFQIPLIWLSVFPIDFNIFEFFWRFWISLNTFDYFLLPTFQFPPHWLSVFPISFKIFEYFLLFWIFFNMFDYFPLLSFQFPPHRFSVFPIYLNILNTFDYFEYLWLFSSSYFPISTSLG